VSLISTKQASQANGTSVQAAQERARQVAEYLRARQLAAQAQMAPLAANARVATQQGVYGARAWTAPRLGLMAQALQDQWAPWMAAALSDAARRIDPVPAKSRRRWPAVAAGVAVIAGGSAAAVIILNRRNSAPASGPVEPGQAASPAATPPEMAAADVNGQSQAP
jgi:hypothetical protein